MNMFKDEIQSCINLVNAFVFEYLKDDFQSLIDFDLSQLKQDSRFGCKGRNFDCDDTNLTRAICFLLWGELFPELSFYDIGTGKKYRGDTLNTFNTVLGVYQAELQSYTGITKSEAPHELLSLAKKFHSIYQTIGNFILLPNIAQTDKKRAYTLNTYRGGIIYKDYFDLFLCQLYTCLTSNHGDEHFMTLIERNDFFFSWLKANGGLKYLSKICWLEDYFCNEMPKGVFQPYVFCLRKKLEWTNSEKSYYIENVKKYILTATMIIKNRATSMVSKLYSICRGIK